MAGRDPSRYRIIGSYVLTSDKLPLIINVVFTELFRAVQKDMYKERFSTFCTIFKLCITCGLGRSVLWGSCQLLLPMASHYDLR